MDLQAPAPRGEAMIELARLVDAHVALEAKLDKVDRDQRDAAETVARLSAALVELEKTDLAGEKVSPAQRAKAEGELAKARAKAAAPWNERRAAVRQAILDQRSRIQSFAGENFAALVHEVEEDGAEAARRMDEGARILVEAAHERARCAERLDQLIAAVRGRSQFGDVALSRCETLVREGAQLLDGGGEIPPTVRPELLPQHAAEPQPESVPA
jgi:hypothetical protein